MKQQSVLFVPEATPKQTYQLPELTKHQRLQKVTLGTVSPGFQDTWLQPGQ